MYCINFQNDFIIGQALKHNDQIILHWTEKKKKFSKIWPTLLWLAYHSLYDFVYYIVYDSV